MLQQKQNYFRFSLKLEQIQHIVELEFDFWTIREKNYRLCWDELIQSRSNPENIFLSVSVTLFDPKLTFLFRWGRIKWRNSFWQLENATDLITIGSEFNPTTRCHFWGEKRDWFLYPADPCHLWTWPSLPVKLLLINTKPIKFYFQVQYHSQQWKFNSFIVPSVMQWPASKTETGFEKEQPRNFCCWRTRISFNTSCWIWNWKWSKSWNCFVRHKNTQSNEF